MREDDGYSLKLWPHDQYLLLFKIIYYFIFFTRARFVGGWGFSTPKFSLIPTGLVTKYIADPLWFYHKSSTENGNY